MKFKKSHTKVQVLLNSSSEVNAITPAYAVKLGLYVRFINVKAQKINWFTLSTYSMVLANFQLKDK